MASLDKNKIRVISHLLSDGIANEKDLMALSVTDMLDTDWITKNDMKVIVALQTAIKAGKLFAFLLDTNGMEVLTDEKT